MIKPHNNIRWSANENQLNHGQNPSGHASPAKIDSDSAHGQTYTLQERINQMNIAYFPDTKKVLRLTLHKFWFTEILTGRKKEEYRNIKPYWISRLDNHQYDYVIFKNGYHRKAPTMIFECKGIRRDDKQGYFYISLGALSDCFYCEELLKDIIC